MSRLLRMFFNNVSAKMLIFFVWDLLLVISASSTMLSDCPANYFHTQGDACHPFLGCNDRSSIKIKSDLPVGYVKKLSIANWNKMEIVYSVPRYNSTKLDFLHGLEMLRTFQNTPYVVEMVGYCSDEESPYLATKFYKHGSAENLSGLLEALNLPPRKEFHARITLSFDYLSILAFLHNSSVGVRVMCDSNDLKKTLSQYVITDDMHLVLLDVDALPEVIRDENVTIKCGHKQLFGHFVAPEQLWPYKDEPFLDSKMPGYDEKTDIWKLPDVLRFIWGQSNQATQLKFHLFDVLYRCKEIDPTLRPDVNDVKNTFRDVLDKLDLKLEL